MTWLIAGLIGASIGACIGLFTGGILGAAARADRELELLQQIADLKHDLKRGA